MDSVVRVRANCLVCPLIESEDDGLKLAYVIEAAPPAEQHNDCARPRFAANPIRQRHASLNFFEVKICSTPSRRHWRNNRPSGCDVSGTMSSPLVSIWLA